MIRVLHVCNHTDAAVAGRSILNLLAHYDRASFELELAAPRGNYLLAAAEKLDTKVHPLDSLRDKNRDCKSMRIFGRLIRSVDHQIIHSHGALGARIAAKRAGRKTVCTQYGTLLQTRRENHPFFRWLTRQMTEHYTDAILADSTAAKQSLIDSGVRSERVEIIRNGVPAEKRLTPEEIAIEKNHYGISGNRFVLGMLSDMGATAGHAYVLDAVHSLKSAGKPVVLLIAGAGALQEQLKATTQAMGLNDCVIFTDAADTRNLLSLLDVQINAAHGSGASDLTLPQGMSMGIPAVATNCGGNPDVITNGENGLLVPVKDPAALAAAVVSLMENKLTYIQMTKTCVQTFNERFTADRYAHKTEEIYTKLAGGTNL